MFLWLHEWKYSLCAKHLTLFKIPAMETLVVLRAFNVSCDSSNGNIGFA
jgi:hypothetical protein